MQKFDWKSLLSIAALITSASALYVSSRQLRIASEQQQSSVFPYLTAAYNTGPSHFAMRINNDGMGPAFISGVEVKHRDSIYDDFYEPVIAFFNENNLATNQNPDSLYFEKSDLLPGWVVRPNSEPYQLFKIQGMTAEQMDKFYGFFTDRDKGIKAKIWYLDIYNNCWLFNFNETTVTRCDKCPKQVLNR
jgi:hypothetical protein